MAELHPRLPVVLDPSPKTLELWLNPQLDWSEEHCRLLKPCSELLTW
jgi:putative SOS response-associated peptidase YedK